jgi:hypothetical protein
VETRRSTAAAGGAHDAVDTGGEGGDAIGGGHRCCKEPARMQPTAASGATDGAAGAARSRRWCYNQRLLVLPSVLTATAAGAARERTTVLPAAAAGAAIPHLLVLQDSSPELQALTAGATSPRRRSCKRGRQSCNSPWPMLEGAAVLLHQRWSSPVMVRDARGIEQAVRERQGGERW